MSGSWRWRSLKRTITSTENARRRRAENICKLKKAESKMAKMVVPEADVLAMLGIESAASERQMRGPMDERETQ